MHKVKRRYKRYKVEGLDLHARSVFTTDVELVDISMTGACIRASEELKVGGDYRIWFNNEGILLPLTCTVRWQTSGEGQKHVRGNPKTVHTAGIQFRESYSDSVAQLKDFIGRLDFPEEQQFAFTVGLMNTRFRPVTKMALHLNHEETYPVKQISLGGMLVVTLDEFKVNRNFPMELFLPDQKRPLRFRGRVASCIQMSDTTAEHVDTGIEFLDMVEQDRTRLNSFIHASSRKG
jgi:c-di-GMP-binding flagellar brake protein YcgR